MIEGSGSCVARLVSAWRTLLLLGFLLLPSAATSGAFDDLAECLAGSGAVFYGAHWCPYCAKQKDRFGDSSGLLPYVECYQEGTRIKLPECEDVRSFPTWVFADGTVRTGVLSLNTLATLSGCPLP